MIKKLINKLKQRKCEHSYEFVGESIIPTNFIYTRASEEYVFKCKKCNRLLILDRLNVIESFNEIYKEMLIEELNKPAAERCANKDLKDKVWLMYINDDVVKDVLSDRYNTVSLSKELRSITEHDIMSNDIKIQYKNITRTGLSVGEAWDKRHLAYSHKGKIIFIDKYRLNYDIDNKIHEEIITLLRRGVEYDYETVKDHVTQQVYYDKKIMRA